MSHNVTAWESAAAEGLLVLMKDIVRLLVLPYKTIKEHRVVEKAYSCLPLVLISTSNSSHLSSFKLQS